MKSKLRYKFLMLVVFIFGVCFLKVDSYADEDISNCFIIEVNYGNTKNIDKWMPQITVDAEWLLFNDANFYNNKRNVLLEEQYYSYSYSGIELYDVSADRFNTTAYVEKSYVESKKREPNIYNSKDVSDSHTFYSYLYKTGGGVEKLDWQEDKFFYVKSISFELSQGQEIEIYSIRIYKVNENKKDGCVKGQMLGYISDKYVVDLSEGNSLLQCQLIFAEDKDGDKKIEASLNNHDKRYVLLNSEHNSIDRSYKYAEHSGVYCALEPYVDKEIKSSVTELEVEISIADEYKAGVESYYRIGYTPKLLDFRFIPDCLYFKATYMDTYGAVHSIKVPVVTSCYASSAELGENPNTNTYYSGRYSRYPFPLHQGNTIAFILKLQDFVGFVGNATIEYNTSQPVYSRYKDLRFKAGELGDYVTRSNDNVSIKSVAVYNIINKKDIKLYNNNTVDVEKKNEQATVKPIWAYDGNSIMISNGKSEDFNWQQTDKYVASPQDSFLGTYLCEIETADLEEAGTYDDILIDISYMTTSGVEKSTGEFYLREACREYYGYTSSPEFSSNFDELDACYYEYVQKGNTIKFFLKLSLTEIYDLEYFSKASIRIKKNRINDITPSDTVDSWIVKKITISKIDSISAPIFVIRDENKKTYIDCHESEYISTRIETCTNEFDINFGVGDGKDPDDTPGIYVDGTKKTINLFTKKVDNDYENALYTRYTNLTFNDASSGIEFNQKIFKYQVTVNVASEKFENDDDSASGTDDSGSDNFFYFQLVFENGKSAYVQANQQISSDGFRAGLPSVFWITTNHDYGELKAVNIIPENSSDNGGAPYDKLNIESIVVMVDNYDGRTMTWTLDGEGQGIGWIGIDYSDSTAASHSESDIVKVCNVAKSGTGVKLLFNIVTDSSEKDGQQVGDIGTEATMKAEIIYIKASDGQTTSTEIDLIEYIKDFNGDNRKEKVDKLVECDGIAFRQNHTDRFIYMFDDIKSIESITIYASTRHIKEKIVIGGISVFLINEGNIDTDRTLNYDGEYIIGGCKKTLVARSRDEDNNAILEFAPGSAARPKTFHFDMETDIMNVCSEGSIYTVTKEPESGNDTMNIMVYTERPVSFNGTIKTLVNYKDIEGQSITVSSSVQKVSDPIYGQDRFAAYKVGCAKMASLCGIVLQAEASKDNIPIQHVIIQRIRAGVVIATYELSFNSGNNDAMKKIRSSSCQLVTGGEEYQKVYIELGDSTDATALISESHDIAVSLLYTSSLGTISKTDSIDGYNSVNYFYTNGELSKDIKPGNIIELTLNESNLDEIASATISATGELTIQVKTIIVASYKGDKLQGWYYCDNTNDRIVSNGYFIFMLKKADKTLIKYGVPNIIDLTFETMDNSQTVGNVGINSAVALEIGYTLENGEEKQRFIKDINDYLVEGNFLADQTAKIRIIAAEGIRSDNITYIKVCPYDKTLNPDISSINEAITAYGGNNIVWGLRKVTVEFGDGELNSGAVHNRVTATVNKLVMSNKGLKVSLRNAIIEAKVNYVDPISGDKEYVYDNEDGEIELPFAVDGIDIKLDVSMFNSNKGWIVDVVNDNAYGEIKYAYVPDPVTIGKEQKYTLYFTGDYLNQSVKKIVITSGEDENIKYTITLKMKNYEESYGVYPLKVVGSTDNGVTKSIYTSQNLEWGDIPEKVEKMTFTYANDFSITPVVTFNKVNGADISYTYVVDKNNSTITVYFGKRGLYASDFELMLSYSQDDKDYEIVWKMHVLGAADPYAVELKYALTYKCQESKNVDGIDIVGYLVLGRGDKLYIPNTDKAVMDITVMTEIFGRDDIKDITDYNDIIIYETVATTEAPTTVIETTLAQTTQAEVTAEETTENAEEATAEAAESESKETVAPETTTMAPTTTEVIETETRVEEDEGKAVFTPYGDGVSIQILFPSKDKEYVFEALGNRIEIYRLNVK